MNSTQRRLVVVADLCELTGRIFPLPAVPNALLHPEPEEPLKPGDQLELRRPDGTVTKVMLHGLQWTSSGEEGLFIELGPQVTKQHLPRGTEIWRMSATIPTRPVIREPGLRRLMASSQTREDGH